MMDFMCTFPATNDVRKYVTGCTGSTEEKAKANALAYYNLERHNNNLPALDKMPEEATLTPLPPITV